MQVASDRLWRCPKCEWSGAYTPTGHCPRCYVAPPLAPIDANANANANGNVGETPRELFAALADKWIEAEIAYEREGPFATDDDHVAKYRSRLEHEKAAWLTRFDTALKAHNEVPSP